MTDYDRQADPYIGPCQRCAGTRTIDHPLAPWQLVQTTTDGARFASWHATQAEAEQAATDWQVSPYTARTDVIPGNVCWCTLPTN
ncbi:MAG: hypothetical protein ACKVWR_19510 [Acidimicrobiales bacterium]